MLTGGRAQSLLEPTSKKRKIETLNYISEKERNLQRPWNLQQWS
jgi:hypothetical protein